VELLAEVKRHHSPQHRVHWDAMHENRYRPEQLQSEVWLVRGDERAGLDEPRLCLSLDCADRYQAVYVVLHDPMRKLATHHVPSRMIQWRKHFHYHHPFLISVGVHAINPFRIRLIKSAVASSTAN
jgi:hypothetical protein